MGGADAVGHRVGASILWVLNAALDTEDFDRFVEALCAKFYAPQFGRPSLAPDICFRALLIGNFEGIGSERGIA